MTEMTVQCPHCNAQGQVPHTLVGKPVRCRCGQSFTAKQPSLQKSQTTLQPTVQPSPQNSERHISAPSSLPQSDRFPHELAEYLVQHQLIFFYNVLIITLASFGSTILLVGTLCPLISAPIFGGGRLINDAYGGGFIIIALVISAITLTAMRMYRALWIPSLASVGYLLTRLIFMNLYLAAAHEQLNNDLADNPFRDLADTAISAVQLDWGWTVLFIGAVLLIGAAVLDMRTAKQRNADARASLPFIIAGVVLMVIFIAIGGWTGTAILEKVG